MMIQSEQGELVALCDGQEDCPSKEYGGTLGFKEFVIEIKGKGWRSERDGGRWTHTCPGCLKDALAAGLRNS